MSIFTQFIRSFYSTKDIASYRFQKIGKTILYVFFLALLAALPMIYHLYSISNKELQFVKTVAAEELPDFEIKNGVLETANPTQIVKERPDFTFIFDPNVTEIPSTYKNNPVTIAVLKDKFIANIPGQEQTVMYDTLGDSPMTKQHVMDLFQTLEDIAPILFGIVAVIMYLYTCFTQFFYTTIFAALALLLRRQTPQKLTYKHLWTMTAYAMTIPTVFFIIMDALMITIPFSHFLLYSFVTMLILFLSLREIPTPKK
ncbi:DUF1189 domain-containing protein [Priestia taiwanensis]|uniref:DUF1189 domain-containing protein n=1 Tax=Priestia taiwanensis TaxID=1347902 RepID=A0A917AUW5_9BACI|nr:DUF1189 domain-containing protein [Priestia taiwanensis]MBM7363785.1 hypothetical protein [Priestia taiwanensis]GGE74100.1 hypothetical protein GCM10007140_25010 [Priestia taiwanensis]